MVLGRGAQGLGTPSQTGPACAGVPIWDKITWQQWGWIRLIFDAQTIIWWPPWVGQVACLPDGDSGMVAITSEGPNPERHHRFCQMSMGFLPTAQSKVPHWGGKENDYTPPPMPHCIKWDAFLPFSEGNIASQDYRMKQPHKMLAYAKALHFWAKKSHLPWASQPLQLAACMKEMRVDGATDIVHWWGSPHQWPAIALGEGNLISILQSSGTWSHMGTKLQ